MYVCANAMYTLWSQIHYSDSDSSASESPIIEPSATLGRQGTSLPSKHKTWPNAGLVLVQRHGGPILNRHWVNVLCLLGCAPCNCFKIIL